MGNYGMKITKSTKNITSSDVNDYQFWSKYTNRSIKEVLTLEVTTNTDVDPEAEENSYTHDFGYIPQFMVFTTSYDGYFINMDYQSGGDYGGGDIWEEYLKAWVTSTEIYVSALLEYYTPMAGTSDGIEKTYTFNIILFMEEVETS